MGTVSAFYKFEFFNVRNIFCSKKTYQILKRRGKVGEKSSSYTKGT